MPPHMLKLSSGVVLSLSMGLGLTAHLGCTSGPKDSPTNGARSPTSVEATSAALAPLDAAVPPSAPIYDPCPTDGTPCRIMPLGDSLTAGDDRDGYRGPLFQRLKTLGRPFDFVGSLPGGTAGTAHEGHPGMHIDLLGSYADTWLPSAKPHVVLLLMGSNDLDMNYLGHLATYAKIIDKCLTLLPNSLFIIGLIPTTTSYPDRVVSFNAALVDIVKARAAQGKHVQMVDTHAALRLRDFGPDGLHPAHPGYVRLADVWYTALAPFMRAR